MSILSAEDVARITGKLRPSAQAQWLSAKGWRYDRNAKGEVVIHEREAERHLCGGRSGRSGPVETPDVEAIRG